MTSSWSLLNSKAEARTNATWTASANCQLPDGLGDTRPQFTLLMGTTIYLHINLPLSFACVTFSLVPSVMIIVAIFVGIHGMMVDIQPVLRDVAPHYCAWEPYPTVRTAEWLLGPSSYASWWLHQQFCTAHGASLSNSSTELSTMNHD